jgi:hypothetical protein
MTDCPDVLGPPSEPPRSASRRWPGGLGLSMVRVIAQGEMASASAGAGALTCPCR